MVLVSKDMNLNTIKIEITNLKIDIIKCSLLLYPSGLLSSIISDRYGRLKFTRDHLSFQESFTRKRKFVSHFDCGPKVQTPLTKNPARSSMTLSPMGALNSSRNRICQLDLINETIKELLAEDTSHDGNFVSFDTPYVTLTRKNDFQLGLKAFFTLQIQ